jgi:hypothetical protein
MVHRLADLAPPPAVDMGAPFFLHYSTRSCLITIYVMFAVTHMSYIQFLCLDVSQFFFTCRTSSLVLKGVMHLNKSLSSRFRLPACPRAYTKSFGRVDTPLLTKPFRLLPTLPTPPSASAPFALARRATAHPSFVHTAGPRRDGWQGA